jgi:hypothetical protein
MLADRPLGSAQAIGREKRGAVDCTAAQNGNGAPPGKRNGQYRHGERTKAAIEERQKFSALLKMLRAGLT